MHRLPDANPRWAWFFDLDGTLVEIAPTPSSVVIDDDLPHLIERLNTVSGGALCLITGRAVSTVEQLLPVPELTVAGQHGFEMRSSTGEIVTSEVKEDFDEIADEVRRVAEKHGGLIMEHKGNSVALHYRRAPKLAGYAHRFMREVQQRHGAGVVLQKGKRVIELKPAGADKGEAIRALMKQSPFAGRVPVFIGDDVTDESGFAVVNEYDGISVKVGPGATAARYRLRDVAQVRDWLAQGLSNYEAERSTNGAA